MSRTFKTYEEIKESQKKYIDQLVKDLGFTEAIRKIITDRDRFKRKSEEAEKAAEYINEYDDYLQNKKVVSSKLLFSADLKGFFGTYDRNVEIELNETVIETLIDYFSDKAKHFENCYMVIDHILNKMGENE